MQHLYTIQQNLYKILTEILTEFLQNFYGISTKFTSTLKNNATTPNLRETLKFEWQFKTRISLKN